MYLGILNILKSWILKNCQDSGNLDILNPDRISGSWKSWNPEILNQFEDPEILKSWALKGVRDLKVSGFQDFRIFRILKSCQDSGFQDFQNPDHCSRFRISRFSGFPITYSFRAESVVPNFADPESWQDSGSWKSWNPESWKGFRILKSWNPESWKNSGSWNPEILKSWNPERV